MVRRVYEKILTDHPEVECEQTHVLNAAVKAVKDSANDEGLCTTVLVYGDCEA